MSGESITIHFERDFFEKLKKHAKKKGYESIPNFIHEVLRRQLFWQKRASLKDAESAYLDKFSSPTPETRKIIRGIRAR